MSNIPGAQFHYLHHLLKIDKVVSYALGYILITIMALSPISSRFFFFF